MTKNCNSSVRQLAEETGLEIFGGLRRLTTAALRSMSGTLDYINQ